MAYKNIPLCQSGIEKVLGMKIETRKVKSVNNKIKGGKYEFREVYNQSTTNGSRSR